MVTGARREVQPPLKRVGLDLRLLGQLAPSRLVDERVVLITDQLQPPERHLDQLPLDRSHERLKSLRFSPARVAHRRGRITDRPLAERRDQPHDLRLPTLVLPKHARRGRTERTGVRPVHLDHRASQATRADRRGRLTRRSDRFREHLEQSEQHRELVRRDEPPLVEQLQQPLREPVELQRATHRPSTQRSPAAPNARHPEGPARHRQTAGSHGRGRARPSDRPPAPHSARR